MYNVYRDVKRKELVAVPDTQPLADIPGFVFEKKVPEVYVTSDTKIAVSQVADSLPSILQEREKKQAELLADIEKNYKELMQFWFSAEGRIINITSLTKQFLKDYGDYDSAFRLKKIMDLLNDNKLYNQRTETIRTIGKHLKS